MNSSEMRTLFFKILLMLFILGCSKDKPGVNVNSETPHFIFRWEEGDATNSEIEEARLFAEQIYSEYEAYFGGDKLPRTKTIIHLGGDAFAGNGELKFPFVDGNGEIFLYRFATGYLGELPHEFVHVLRLYQGWSSDGFLEEGLAEAMSSELFPANIGFSLYGYPTTVAAGLWLQQDDLIPLQELKDRHFDLNLKCLAQSYTLRADFFSFLLEMYGKQQFMDFIYADDADTIEGYERAFGKSFSELEEQWLLSLQQRLDSLNDGEAQILAYQTRMNDLGFYICTSGVDF